MASFFTSNLSPNQKSPGFPLNAFGFMLVTALIGGCNNQIQIRVANSNQCIDSKFATENPETCPSGVENATLVPELSFGDLAPVTGAVGIELTVSPKVLNNKGAAITLCVANPPLPVGLVLSETSCVIAGTPVTPSSGTYLITATNFAGTSKPAVVTIIIDASVPTISFAGVTPAVGSVGSVISLQPSTLNPNGAEISECSTEPALPTGLVISPTLCVISGTPESPSSATYSVFATNAAGKSLSANVSIVIDPSSPILSFESASPVQGRVGQALTVVPSTLVDNGSQLSGCSVDTPLPAGLSIASGTCVISGTPVEPSSGAYSVTASNSYGSSQPASLTITITPSVPAISFTGVTPAVGSVGSVISLQPSTLNPNGAEISECSTEPALPTGLVISPTLCVISGTPESPSVGIYSVKASNSTGASDAAVLAITINSAVPSLSYDGVSPAVATVGSVISISPTLFSANGSSIESCTVEPALPVGLVIQPALCVVSGTPEMASSGTYFVTATNAVGASAAAILTITINALPPSLSYENNAPVVGYVNSVLSISPTNLNQNGAELTACNVSPALPSGLAINQQTCAISGIPVEVANNTYTVTATNSAGTSSPVSLTINIGPEAPAGTCYISGTAHPGLNATCSGLSATDGRFYVNSVPFNGLLQCED